VSPDTVDLKRWTDTRARACRVGVPTFRTDPADGPVQFFSVRFGVPRQHADMDALREYVSDIEQTVRCTA
jgi:hypothetical protein